MQIDENTIDRIALLAKLQFNSEAKKRIKEDMNKMLDFIDKLNELDTENVEPLLFITDEVNVLREDIAKATISQQEALKNSPDKNSDYFKVPKVIK